MSKRIYHPLIPLAYKNGLLPQSFISEIPASTLSVWRNKGNNVYYGWEYVANLEKRLLSLKQTNNDASIEEKNTCLSMLVLFLSGLLHQSSNKKEIFKQSRSVITDIIERLRHTLGFFYVISVFKISASRYYAWKYQLECTISTDIVCKRIFYNQVTWHEINTIREYMESKKYQHWNSSSVYCQMIRDKKAGMSISTFYKYVNELNLKRNFLYQNRRKHKTNPPSNAINEKFHIDVTVYRTSTNAKAYIYLLIDNFSRFILSWKVELKNCSAISALNLKDAFEKYDLYYSERPIELITDNGSENKGFVEEFLSQEGVNMKKLIALKDIEFSNSMIEAVNKRIKYDYLYHNSFIDIADLKRFLKNVVLDYNQKPLYALNGYTPYEVYNGALPDKEMIKSRIITAQQERKQINLHCNYCGGM